MSKVTYPLIRARIMALHDTSPERAAPGPNGQGELFAVFWEPRRHPFRLRVNDLIRLDGRLGRVIRVTECAAVVLVNRPVRQFKTRFDKPVRFQPSPAVVRIAANSEIEVLNRRQNPPRVRKPRKEVR